MVVYIYYITSAGNAISTQLMAADGRTGGTVQQSHSKAVGMYRLSSPKSGVHSPFSPARQAGRVGPVLHIYLLPGEGQLHLTPPPPICTTLPPPPLPTVPSQQQQKYLPDTLPIFSPSIHTVQKLLN
jgi:hypothetical protein